MGMAEAKKRAQGLKERALDRLRALPGDASLLAWLACYAVDRRV
jgi:geranylgeranyl pyrophosphate synthase